MAGSPQRFASWVKGVLRRLFSARLSTIPERFRSHPNFRELTMLINRASNALGWSSPILAGGWAVVGVRNSKPDIGNDQIRDLCSRETRRIPKYNLRSEGGSVSNDREGL